MWVRAIAVGLTVSLLWAAGAVASGTHQGRHSECKATPEQREAALDFARRTEIGIERYLQVANAIGDGFVSDGKPTKAIMHYDNKENRQDDRFLDPLNPEALVYQNTYTGPKLLGALYTMAGTGRRGPAFGGCLTEWHHHRFCKPPAGPTRAPQKGKCPAGFELTRSHDMIHTWIVPMAGGPYAHRPDQRYACWLKTTACL